MIKPLRKRHLQIWSVLLVLIPTGIITARLSVKKPVHDNTLQPESQRALPKVIKSAEKENYIVRLRTNDSLPEQLEWINKTVLNVPSAVIYKTSPNLSQGGSLEKSLLMYAKLIGRIEAKGSYYFPLQRDSTNEKSNFILYDFIHEKIIDSVKF